MLWPDAVTSVATSTSKPIVSVRPTALMYHARTRAKNDRRSRIVPHLPWSGNAGGMPKESIPCSLLEPHAVAHFRDRLPGDGRAFLRPRVDRVVHELRLRLELRGALLDRRQLRHHVLVQHLLAVDAPPPR